MKADVLFLPVLFVSLPFWRCDYFRVNSMSFAGKNLTQGGQMTAYRWRMFFLVNNWIGFWIFILCCAGNCHLFLTHTTGGSRCPHTPSGRVLAEAACAENHKN